ncbi:MAG: tetratricopeptide (TPR) repeat protein [Glaciecola sp.]|jgi:tetratricopeptide (TPR) repeat protein
MKNLIVTLMLLFVGFIQVSLAQTDHEKTRLDSAKILYDAGKYNDSQELYLSFVDSGIVSEALYYNLGNCYFKTGNKVQAVLYFEKALKLNNGNKDAAHNLTIVNETLVDKFEKLPTFSIRPLFLSINSVLSYNLLGVLSMLCLFVGGLLFFRMKKKGKQFTFSNSWVVLVLAIFFYTWGGIQKKIVSSAIAGIVSINGMEVHSEPNYGATLLFELNEGTKVEFVDENSEWYNIKTQDGNQGWVEKKLVLEI